MCHFLQKLTSVYVWKTFLVKNCAPYCLVVNEDKIVDDILSSVRAPDFQCKHCKRPKFNPRVLRHNRIICYMGGRVNTSVEYSSMWRTASLRSAPHQQTPDPVYIVVDKLVHCDPNMYS